MSRRPGRNAPCPCGSGKKFKRCCIDAPTKPRLAALLGPSGNALSIVLETPIGVMVREIPDASPLTPGTPRGPGAEQATEEAAAIFGLPDFVYRAEVRQRGTGRRELGDRIVIVGDAGLVVQVKSRSAPAGEPARERAWLQKNLTRAAAQARGSVRELRIAPARLTNARGRTIEIDGSRIRWTPVLIVDHPNLPRDFVPDVLGGDLPTVALTRRDWDFLFAQLKSTHAVAAYLDRIAGEAIELGSEPLRYHDLALDDLAAKPEPLDLGSLPGVNTAHAISSPMLPLSAAGGGDEQSHRLFRLILEDIASVSFQQSAPTQALVPIDERARLRVLAELDRLPITMRSSIGAYLLDGLAQTGNVPAGEVSWRLRRVVGPKNAGHLAFGVCSTFSDDIQGAFGSWVSLRHHQTRLVFGDSDLTTVGVLLTPRRDERPWDTTMVAVHGDVGFAAEELASLEKVWPPDSTERLLE